MRVFWAITILLGAGVLSVAQGKETDPVHSFHGDARYAVLTSPDRVESYLLSDEANSPKRFAGAALVRKGPDLNPTQRRMLQSIVRDANTYRFGQYKMCLFHPDLGLRFVKGKQVVDVAFCFSCDEWRFHDSDHPDGQTEDIDPARPKLLRLARALFPKHAPFKKYPLRDK